ncbi:Aste57867_14246 [Aphanomyces stellatus]|uniref:Aste57867_14246 protein n=1 Tax=Aphanomyces stellatus TaxID=120398 RepID=A0A485L2L9_9STRA|nr:hypothetical protein As57867_014195 [Aphanomyces stellatus]VFT91071.1 Aste57867_14246 [Aphanomyces stellatus]
MKPCVFVAALFLSITDACTLIGVGHKVTLDGSTMVAHTNDAMATPVDLRVVRVPAMTHAPGARRAIYNNARHAGYPRYVSSERGPDYMPRANQTLTPPLGSIPQVASTYAYWDIDFGMQNEVQLSIGETTCAAKTVGYPIDLPHGHSLLNIQELSKIALERCDSAECAVKTMGALAEEYGFFGEYSDDPLKPENAGSAEALVIADKYSHLWVFHILTGPHNTGAVWAAQRIQDDQFIIVPNTFVIRELNLTDSANFLASANVHAFAYAQGWADPSRPFDFTAAYAFAVPGASKPLYGGRRMWRAYDMVAPSLQLDPEVGFHARVPTYPFSVTPDTLLTPVSIMRIFSDYYQDTPYDLTQGMAAGPFHDPARYAKARNTSGNWERSISMHRTTHSFVLQTRAALPDAIGGLAWFGHGIPADTVYFPIACGQSRLPAVFNQGRRTLFDSESTFWAFHFTSNWAHLRYDKIHAEIAVQRLGYRAAAIELQARADADCRAANYSAASLAAVEATFNKFIVDTTQAWWAFAWHLVSSYNDGYHWYNESATGGATVLYHADWANQTEFVLYPRFYHPPGQAAREVNLTMAIDADLGVAATTASSSDVLNLPSGFVLGFACGTMSLSLVLAVIVLAVRMREGSPPPSSASKASEPARVVEEEDVATVAANDDANDVIVDHV